MIPGLGRSSGGGHGNPLQYSCLENPTDRGAWQTTVHGVRQDDGITGDGQGCQPYFASQESPLSQRRPLSFHNKNQHYELGWFILKVTSVHAKLLQLCSTICNPMDCSPPRLLCPWDSPGKNTGVRLPCHSPGYLPNPGIKPEVPMAPIAGVFFHH